MNIQEKIAELEVTERELWDKCKAFEASPEYKQMIADKAALDKAWCDVWQRIKTLRELAKEGAWTL